jgi:hypothetical protein
MAFLKVVTAERRQEDFWTNEDCESNSGRVTGFDVAPEGRRLPLTEFVSCCYLCSHNEQRRWPNLLLYET